MEDIESIINKPLWETFVTGHESLIIALKIHVGLTNSNHSKDEILRLVQRVHPQFNEYVSRAFRHVNLLKGTSYAIAFTYLLRSIITVVLKHDENNMPEDVKTFLMNTNEFLVRPDLTLFSRQHPVKLAVTENEQFITIRVKLHHRICAFELPMNPTRSKINIKLTNGYSHIQQATDPTASMNATTYSNVQYADYHPPSTLQANHSTFEPFAHLTTPPTPPIAYPSTSGSTARSTRTTTDHYPSFPHQPFANYSNQLSTFYTQTVQQKFERARSQRAFGSRWSNK